ncbi:MAG: hypothetical protein ACLQU1_16500 [Bryobacteraceae bacterium]
MVKSRSSALLSVVLVFLSGALVGAVANRLYMTSTVLSLGPNVAPRPDRNPEDVRKHLVAEMRAEVKLDDQQVKQLETIYDHTREQFNEMHQRWNGESQAARDKQTEEIKAMLRPGQVALFDQLRAKHDAERKARHKGDKSDRK